MTDADIVALYNGILEFKGDSWQEWNKTVIEEPPGEPQIDYHENSDQWVPRGEALRCIVGDGGPEGKVIIHIDDKELSLGDFGRMLTVYAGWGMRIVFVPEEFVTENPTVKVRKPEEERVREAPIQSETLGISSLSQQALNRRGCPLRRSYSATHRAWC